MSSSGSSRGALLENLKCSICLEFFQLPQTIICGHTFCQYCICKHWNEEELKGKGTYTCPECRTIFPQRPEPCKNVSLSAVVDHLKETEEQKHLVVRHLSESRPVAPRALCSKHKRALDMFCCTDHRCICCECQIRDCRSHQLELIEDWRKQKQEEFILKLGNNIQQTKQIEERISKREQVVQNIKASCGKMVIGIQAQFEQLRSALEECCSLTVQDMKREENLAKEQVDQDLQNLRSYLTALQQHRREMEQLIESPDDVEFLRGITQLTPPGSAPMLPDVPLCGTAQVDAVTRILPEALRLFQVEFPNALHPCQSSSEVKESSGATSSVSVKESISNSFRMSELRAQLFTEYQNLTFDPKTANKYIYLSRQGQQAKHKTRLPEDYVPDLLDRFQSWQVMCTQGFFQGRHYWEVEISDFFVQIGVAYHSLPRTKGEENKIGNNRFSWSLQILSNRHSAWHDNKETLLQVPPYRKIGVRLDYDAGTLNFYGVEDGRLALLHSFTCFFSDTLYPVFWIGEDVSVRLHQVEQLPSSNIDIAQSVEELKL